MLKYFNEMRMLSCLLTCQTSNKCILLEDIVIIASFSITTLLMEHKICSMFGISVILYVLLEKTSTESALCCESLKVFQVLKVFKVLKVFQVL